MALGVYISFFHILVEFGKFMFNPFVQHFVADTHLQELCPLLKNSLSITSLKRSGKQNALAGEVMVGWKFEFLVNILVFHLNYAS